MRRTSENSIPDGNAAVPAEAGGEENSAQKGAGRSKRGAAVRLLSSALLERKRLSEGDFAGIGRVKGAVKMTAS